MWGVLLEILCYLSHTDEVFRWPASPKCLLPRPDRALTLGGLKEPAASTAGFFVSGLYSTSDPTRRSSEIRQNSRLNKIMCSTAYFSQFGAAWCRALTGPPKAGLFGRGRSGRSPRQLLGGRVGG